MSSSRHPLRQTWASMIQRCTNPRNPDWRLYGARGITVCERWLESFESFLEDVGERPPGRSLDRIDTNGNYDPANVRWATPLEQANNVRPRAGSFVGKYLSAGAVELKRWRLARKISQVALADSLGIEQTFVSKIEHGTSAPGRDTAVGIQRITGGLISVGDWTPFAKVAS